MIRRRHPAPQARIDCCGAAPGHWAANGPFRACMIVFLGGSSSLRRSPARAWLGPIASMRPGKPCGQTPPQRARHLFPAFGVRHATCRVSSRLVCSFPTPFPPWRALKAPQRARGPPRHRLQAAARGREFWPSVREWLARPRARASAVGPAPPETADAPGPRCPGRHFVASRPTPLREHGRECAPASPCASFPEHPSPLP
jgi:hypothetical protein